jgi:hypothetical protein
VNNESEENKESEDITNWTNTNKKSRIK